jgi:hypothetical protein
MVAQLQRVYPYDQSSSVVDHHVAPATTICAGDTATLTADPGYVGYLWNTEPLHKLFVTMSGTYQVTVTDANGCMAVQDSVTINVTPHLLSSSAAFYTVRHGLHHCKPVRVQLPISMV